jgi:hypothetical protein
MFEKEAEEWAIDYVCKDCSRYKECKSKEHCTCKECSKEKWQNGAVFGYNKCKEELNHKGLALQSDMDKTIEQNIALKKKLEKSNEWHYVKDGDLPEVDNRIVLCVCVDGYIDEKKHYILKLLTRKEFPLFQPVYAWKEIILPGQI